MTTTATLCFLRRKEEVLLIYKKRGFGEGKFNGPGGKVQNGETPENCAIREVEEELGYKPQNLSFHGILVFYFGQQQKPAWEVHVFQTHEFTGELRESEEASGHWTSLNEIPFDKMWPDDEIWLPKVLNDEVVHGTFWFTEDMKTLLEYKLQSN